MALFSLIFRSPTRAQIGALQLDASIAESHERTAAVSKSAIEDGSSIADHVTLEPKKLTIEGIVSDTPISIISSIVGTGISAGAQQAAAISSGAFGTLAGVGAGVAGGKLAGLITGTPRDAKDAFKYLESLWRERQKFSVITALQKYDDMIITSLSAPRSKDVGGSFRFTVSMEEITIVSSAVVKVPAFKVDPSAQNTAPSNADLGKQDPKEASEATQEKGSFMFQLFDGAKGIIKGLF